MSPAWMAFYPTDYLADTIALTTLEHGAYFLLILHYWRDGGLPDDDAKLARIARMSAKEWAKCRPVIAEYFTPDWRHNRIDEELKRAIVALDRRSSAGKKGAEAKWQSHSNRIAKA